MTTNYDYLLFDIHDFKNYIIIKSFNEKVIGTETWGKSFTFYHILENTEKAIIDLK